MRSVPSLSKALVLVVVASACAVIGLPAVAAQPLGPTAIACRSTTAVSSTSAASGFVRLAYCQMLNRPPDTAGARYWQEQLEQRSLTTTDLVRALIDSDEFADQRRADPFATLARIQRVAPTVSAPVGQTSGDAARDKAIRNADDGFRSSRELSAPAFEAWVADRALQGPSSVTPALVHGRFDGDQQRINVAYVHLSATRGMRVSPGDRGRSTVGTWAEEIGAHVAINGNWYAPWDGPAVANGQVYAGSDHSYTALFGTTAAGDWVIQHHRDSNDSVDARIVEGVAGHPTLVYRGARTTDFGTDPAFLNRHPRTAIGVDESGDILILVTVDGRQAGARGMTGSETAVLMERLGAYDAVMLDGGGSTTMWIAGQGVVNRPSGGLRAVGNQVAVFGD